MTDIDLKSSPFLNSSGCRSGSAHLLALSDSFIFFFVLIVEEETDYKAWLAGQRESLPDQSMKEDLSGRYLDIVKLTYLGT